MSLVVMICGHHCRTPHCWYFQLHGGVWGIHTGNVSWNDFWHLYVAETFTCVLWYCIDVSEMDSAATQPASVLTQPASVSTQPASVSMQPASVSTQPASVSMQPASISVQKISSSGNSNSQRDQGRSLTYSSVSSDTLVILNHLCYK